MLLTTVYQVQRLECSVRDDDTIVNVDPSDSISTLKMEAVIFLRNVAVTFQIMWYQNQAYRNITSTPFDRLRVLS